MYDINETIVAVSSGSGSAPKKIIRISGDKTFDALCALTENAQLRQRKIVPAKVKVCDDFSIDVLLYLFPSPASYTGDDLAEIHLSACEETIDLIFEKIISAGCRVAQPGEFTYRAYLNGKLGLSQAEAVAQIISSSNEYQLCAAQKLFAGAIERQVSGIYNETLELLSLIEAGLDFSGEDIEIISKEKAMERLKKIRGALDELLAGSITFEQIAEAPSVIITGSANAGKSSLVNALIGKQRSIVSDQSGTTRDVLSHWLKLKNCDCVLLDSAGIIGDGADTIQNLANIAAAKAIGDAAVKIFCVDAAKQDYSIDLEVLQYLRAEPDICIASKCDLLTTAETAEKLKQLKNIFGCDFLATSTKTSAALEELKNILQRKIITQNSAATEQAEKTALTQRHTQAITEAIKDIETACGELENAGEETAALVLRSVLQKLSSFNTEHIDEAILDTIFSRFCIGK